MYGACARAAARSASPHCPPPACPTAWPWTPAPALCTSPIPSSALSGACPPPAAPPPPWSTDLALAPTGFLGANGLKIHNGALWATNLDKGTVLRIPILADGRAGTARVTATGLPGIDDFAFTGHGDQIIAALNTVNQVALIQPDGLHTTVLTAADGLQGPTSIALRGDTVHVMSAAYLTAKDPNLILAHLRG
ncbi:hypothetical protein GCM10020254_81150 [Streptomyces goshikiensis]